MNIYQVSLIRNNTYPIHEDGWPVQVDTGFLHSKCWFTSIDKSLFIDSQCCQSTVYKVSWNLHARLKQLNVKVSNSDFWTFKIWSKEVHLWCHLSISFKNKTKTNHETCRGWRRLQTPEFLPRLLLHFQHSCHHGVYRFPIDQTSLPSIPLSKQVCLASKFAKKKKGMSSVMTFFLLLSNSDLHVICG